MSEDDYTLCTARSKHLIYEKSRCCKILQLSSERYKGCVGDILPITPASLPLPPPPEGLDAGRNMKQLCAIDQYPVYQNSDQLALCFLTSNIKSGRVRKCVSLIQTQAGRIDGLYYLGQKFKISDLCEQEGMQC